MLDQETKSTESDVIKIHDGAIGIGCGAIIGSMITLLPRPEFALLPLIGICSVVFASLNLHLGLGLLIFISYARLSDTLVHYHHAPSIVLPLILGLLLLVLYRWIISGVKPQGIMKPITLMSIYLLACLTSLLSARAPEITLLGLQELIKDILFAITLMLVSQQDHERSLRTSVWALMLSGFLMSAVSAYQYLTQSFDSDFGGLAQAAKQHLSGTVQSFRISGTIGDPNFFAQILLVVVPISFDRMMHEKGSLLRILGLLVFLSALSSILFTFSRGALVGLAGMSAIVLVKHRPSKEVLIAAVALSLISVLFLPERYLDRLTALSDAVSSANGGVMEDSLRGRISELVAGLLMFIENPLFGVGLGNYPIEYQDYAQRIGYESRHSERHAHNMFVEWVAETGLFGGMVMAALIGLIFKRLALGHQALLRRGNPDDARMLAAFRLGLVGYLIASLFLHAAFPRYFWLFAAIAMAIPDPMIEKTHLLRPQARRIRLSTPPP